MEIQIYNVNDARIHGYNSVFFASGDAEAMRHYMVLLIQPGGMFNQTPSDFSLVHIGSFNSETGEFTNSLPRTVCTFTEIEHNLERYTQQRDKLHKGGELLGGESPQKTSEADKESESEPVFNNYN